ncbi:hypothetical protein TNCV_908911 [Trichonephila clavipes]|nr:hypothetical protein TNCV_908911 [Trichonephila clavipes]
MHVMFPGGHPSTFWLRMRMLNFGDRTITSVFQHGMGIGESVLSTSLYKGPFAMDTKAIANRPRNFQPCSVDENKNKSELKSLSPYYHTTQWDDTELRINYYA